MIKNTPAMWETWVQSLGCEEPLEEGMANPLQYSCLESPHGPKGLVGKESDMTEQLRSAQHAIHSAQPCLSHSTMSLKAVLWQQMHKAALFFLNVYCME